MHRLKHGSLARLLVAALFLLAAAAGACAQAKPVVRDQLEVEKLRLRITKVRNAIAETRGVIASSRGAPYLPEIYMRLAELLSEEARYHYMVAYEREQRGTKSLHVPQVRFLKERAIATYQMILKRYPDTHLADRILFNMSHEQRELGDFDEMKKTLEKLISQYPESPYRTEASLVLGDFHFDKMEFVRAREYYNGIVRHEKDPLRGLAYYKLGWVFVNVGDCKQALDSFEKAILVQREADEPRDGASAGMGGSA
jgi:tetratricopeptide (TPR) repeat protein